MKNSMYIHLKLKIIFLFSALTLLLTACGNDDKLRALQTYVANLKKITAAQAKKVVPIEFHLPVPITYQAAVPAGTGGPISSKAINIHPLQAYPLKSLQFLGVLVQNNQSWAYFTTPDNLTYRAKEGDVIGNNYGRIISINANHVDVLEEHTEAGKKPTERIITLQVKE